MTSFIKLKNVFSHNSDISHLGKLVNFYLK